MENNEIEYKSKINDDEDFKAEITAFLNSDNGGLIVLGVNDNGEPIQFESEPEKVSTFKSWEEKLANWISDSFEPEIRHLVDIESNLFNITLIIQAGDNKPYRFKNKRKSSYDHIFISSGSTKRKASTDEINRMIKKHDSNTFDSEVSKLQNLNFDYVKSVFRNLEIKFDELSLNLRKTTSRKYNYAAYLLSEENQNVIKLAVFDGINIDSFKDKKEFYGPLPKQIDYVLATIDIHNSKSATITKSSQRIEVTSYPETALRESVINAFVHRDYTLSSDIKIEIYDDRITISSPGSIPDGLTVDDIKEGSNPKRNPVLIHALDKMQYIENYGSGIRRIYSSYKDFKEPEIIATENQFKIVLFNRNYKEDFNDHSDFIVQYLRIHGPSSRSKIQENLDLQKSYTLDLLKQLRDNNTIKIEGSGRSTKYRLNER